MKKALGHKKKKIKKLLLKARMQKIGLEMLSI